MQVTIKNVATSPELTQFSLKKEIYLKASRHAEERAAEKNITLPRLVKVTKGSVVEVESINGVVSKLVVRLPDTVTRDVVYVLVPKQGYWLLVTAWTNHVEDNHATLDLRRLG